MLASLGSKKRKTERERSVDAEGEGEHEEVWRVLVFVTSSLLLLLVFLRDSEDGLKSEESR